MLGSATLFVQSVLCTHNMVLSVNTYDSVVSRLRHYLNNLIMSSGIVISRHVLE